MKTETKVAHHLHALNVFALHGEYVRIKLLSAILIRS